MILRLMENDSIEDSTLIYIGNLSVHYFSIVESNIDLKLIETSIRRLNNTEMPDIIKTLLLIFSRLILIDQDNFLRILTNIKVENNSALVILLNKWLSDADYIQEKNLKFIVFLALTSLVGDKTKNTFFDNPYISQVAHEEQEGNLFLRIFSCLIYVLNKELNEISDEGKDVYNDEIFGKTSGVSGHNDYDDLKYLNMIDTNFNLKVLLKNIILFNSIHFRNT